MCDLNKSVLAEPVCSFLLLLLAVLLSVQNENASFFEQLLFFPLREKERERESKITAVTTLGECLVIPKRKREKGKKNTENQRIKRWFVISILFIFHVSTRETVYGMFLQGDGLFE